MKKFFTLIAMALMAVSANAREQMDFSGICQAGVPAEFGAWEYKGVRLADSEPVKNEEAKTADDSNVKYFDASAFDYLCIKYKENSAKFRFILQYKCKGTIGQWGTEFNEVMEYVTSNTSGMVAIKLDAAQKATIFQYALQPENAGSITVEEIYFATEAEYTEDAAAYPVTKWVPETKALDLASATGGWGDPVYDKDTHQCSLPKDGAGGWWATGDFSDYDYLIFEVADFVKGGWAQFSLFGETAPIEKEEGYFVQIIDISNMKRNTTDTSVYQYSGTNIVLQGGAGTSWTWKQAYFATAEYVQNNRDVITAISAVKTVNTQNAVRYNLAGQKVDAAYKGVVIENGKKFVVK
jgi:hypothetical protein